MLELTQWFATADFAPRPWLLLGKGPSFAQHRHLDLTAFNTMSLNHVVAELPVDVAHIIDVDVVGDCAEALRHNCQWLLMPYRPHVRSQRSPRALKDWFGEHPVLRELDERGRLVWYNLGSSPRVGSSPRITSGSFSSEAALRILALMGVRTVRSLGIDGGRSYASTFRHLEASTLLANGAQAFDLQFERIAAVVEEFDLDFRPAVEPVPVVIDGSERDLVAIRVLEYSLRKAASEPLDVQLRIGRPAADAAENGSRTVHLPPDSLVLGDIAAGEPELLRYPDPDTQPWRSDEHPLADIWMEWYREAVAVGAVPPDEVERLIAAGAVKPSLRSALRLAPSRRSLLPDASMDLATARQRIAELEAGIDALERSWSWRIGSALVRVGRAPVELVAAVRHRSP